MPNVLGHRHKRLREAVPQLVGAFGIRGDSRTNSGKYGIDEFGQNHIVGFGEYWSFLGGRPEFN